ncbi:MAG: glycosyltransferase family 39 protein [Bacteroidetes bacterium]|nr:glycosyltransferase family 39 protein [Bacteroidota bacterium]
MLFSTNYLKKNIYLIYLLLFVLGALLSFPFLGSTHLFDWDEINFAECAREMLVTNNYKTVQINFKPFWEKPPLFIWLQAASMKVFGVNEFAARFPNAVCGVTVLLMLFSIGRKIVSTTFGLIWVLVYAGSLLPQLYFKSGIIDPWFNLFIFLGIYQLLVFTDTSQTPSNYRLTLSGLFIGLAIMTKGPVALLIYCTCLLCYLVVNRFKTNIKFQHLVLFFATALSIGGLWFLFLLLSGNKQIIYDFFEYQIRLLTTQDAGHGGPFFFHFIILFIGCFPASIFAIFGFKNSATNSPTQKHVKIWMMILFWVVLILFSIVKTKIIHYSSLCYFPLTYLASYFIYQVIHEQKKWNKWISGILVFIGSLLTISFAVLPLVDKYKQEIIKSKLIKDPFAEANLQADVHWRGFESLIGALILATLITYVFYVRKNKIQKAILLLFAGTMIAFNLVFLIVLPKIEQYSQNAAIEFFKSLKDKECYAISMRYKSYAQLFYAQKKPTDHPMSIYMDWLVDGEIDKPCYFSTKITNEENVRNNFPQLQEVGRKNGFVFYVRNPPK